MLESTITDKIGTGLRGKRILLTTLDSPFLDDEYVFPYLGILYLMSTAIRAKADVYYTDKFDINSDADVVGISCMTPQGSQAYSICREIKKRHPKTMVILGGPHATHYLDECRKQPFDIIVTGDGERVFEELILGQTHKLASRLSPKSSAEQLIFHDSLTKKEMNSYPIPLREKTYIKKYLYTLNGIKTTTLNNSRGCPMRCAFCESAGTKVKWFSPEHFKNETQNIIDLGIKGIMIYDDIFAMSLAKVKPYLEILKHFHEENGLVFRCFGHAKIMTPELASLLYESGCVEIAFGGESASQEILDTVNKGTTVEQMHAFVETVIRAGMRVKAFFIIGLPGETEQTFKETSNFIRKYRLRYPKSFEFDLTVFFPYKGTSIGDSARRGETLFKIRPTREWSEIDSNGYGAYKKKKGTADIVIETYDWEKARVLLSGKRIEELRRETASLSGRYETDWQKYDNEITQCLAEDDIANFTNWLPIRNTMFCMPSDNHSLCVRVLTHLQGLADWDKWEKAIVESPVGNPKPCEFYPQSSYHLIFQANHLSHFLLRTKCKLEDLDTVFEFGAGYGCMCRLIYNLGFNGKYVIMDLPAPLTIQRYYLRETTNGEIEFLSREADFTKEIKGNSLFVAMWSLSEVDIALRERILSAVNAKYVFIIYQDTHNCFNNAEFFSDFVKGNTNYQWDCFEMPHLVHKKKHYYLFGERIGK